jgi:hypothetical protein
MYVACVRTTRSPKDVILRRRQLWDKSECIRDAQSLDFDSCLNFLSKQVRLEYTKAKLGWCHENKQRWSHFIEHQNKVGLFE